MSPLAYISPLVYHFDCVKASRVKYHIKTKVLFFVLGPYFSGSVYFAILVCCAISWCDMLVTYYIFTVSLLSVCYCLCGCATYIANVSFPAGTPILSVLVSVTVWHFHWSTLDCTPSQAAYPAAVACTPLVPPPERVRRGRRERPGVRHHHPPPRLLRPRLPDSRHQQEAVRHPHHPAACPYQGGRWVRLHSYLSLFVVMSCVLCETQPDCDTLQTPMTAPAFFVMCLW